MIQRVVVQPAETRTVMRNIRWDTYVDLAEQRDGSVPRMTYDEGVLELMSPKRQHEGIGTLIGRLIETWTEVKGIEIQSVKSTTFKRADLSKGFEADESYYIEHALEVRGKDEIDLTVDPPPDLVVEVEITRSAIAKMKLFAAMGIPEVWRHDGEQLTFAVLESGEYRQVSESNMLPGFTPALAQNVLSRRQEEGETKLITDFRQSIR